MERFTLPPCHFHYNIPTHKCKGTGIRGHVLQVARLIPVLIFAFAPCRCSLFYNGEDAPRNRDKELITMQAKFKLSQTV
jgi:hypothetical protein